ncbi:chromate transporter [Alicyclobacillus sp. SO9]|uniref:chromate transporter n=1 Tax=Alicyclobacillus sp. SO9 TaxID=2665646 RepID=UPI0018E76D33|nr:chromate transporter [Alicyclobacillus sp. SO9]QQE79361.1 chromate transporter [Alicyclobacillus sp. SO9]
MNSWHVFLGFLIANLLGYGGGPSTIPLMQSQIVTHYQWMNNAQFANLLAIGNALPGPIATKIAAAVGYQEGGALGLLLGIVATVVPSAVALILMLKVLNKFRQSRVVKGMTMVVQPVIAILMILLTWQVFHDSTRGLGILQTVIIALVSLWAIKVRKIHPALVIVAAFVYGGVVLPLI